MLPLLAFFSGIPRVLFWEELVDVGLAEGEDASKPLMLLICGAQLAHTAAKFGRTHTEAQETLLI